MAGPRLQHAAMNVPPGSQEKVRAFYGGILGLEEKQPPQSLAHLNLVWFAAGEGEMELHFRPDPHPPDGTDRRDLCLVVDDLEDYRRRLTDAGVAGPSALDKRARRPCLCGGACVTLWRFSTLTMSSRV